MPEAIEYFAFIESIEEMGPPREDIAALLQAREAEGLTYPTHALWLDCVEAPYFMELPWRDEPCEINNPKDSDRRRDRLAELDDAAFRAALLLINGGADGAERDDLMRFAELDWHLIRIQDRDGLPVLLGPDFDLAPEGTHRRYLQYRRACHLDELNSLRNVFSLNFLPDADFEGGGKDGGATPFNIGPRGHGPDRPGPQNSSNAKPTLTHEQLTSMERVLGEADKHKALRDYLRNRFDKLEK